MQQIRLYAAGELVTEGSPSKIKSEQPGQLYEIRFADLQTAYQFLRQKLDPWRVSVFADTLHIVLDNPEKDLVDLQESCTKNGLTIIESRPL